MCIKTWLTMLYLNNNCLLKVIKIIKSILRGIFKYKAQIKRIMT